MIGRLMALVLALVVGAPVLSQDDGHDDHGADTGSQLTIETAPAQAQIDMSCVFETECLEAEPCTAAGFDASLDGAAGGMDAQSMVVQARLVSAAATVELLGVQDGGALSLSGGVFEARHLLTVGDDGAARYSVHYADGPMLVSYLGQCEGE